MVATPDWFNVVNAPYNADPTGATDSTAAIQSAITAAQTAGGGVIYLPTGTYKVGGTGSALTVNADKNIVIQGDSAYLTKISTVSATVNIINASGTGGTNTFEIKDIGLTSSVTRTAGSFINTNVGYSTIDSVFFSNYFYGITSTDNVGTIQDCEFDNPVVGSGVGIFINGWSGAGVIDNVLMRPPGPSNQGLAGIQIVESGGVLISNCNIIQQGFDLLINPGSGQQASGIYAVNTYFDTATAGMVINPTSTGAVTRCLFTNCWFSSHTSSAGGAVVDNSGSGPVSGIHFSNCIAVLNTGSGISVNAGTDISISGGLYANNGNGIWISGGITDFTIEGASVGAYGGLSGNTNWGAVVANGASNHYIVTNNRCRGNGTGGIFDGGTGGTKSVTNNIA